MDDVKSVTLKTQILDEEGNNSGEIHEYEMVYDPENEYFIYTVEGIEEGTHEYWFLVEMKDGTTEEISDPYNLKNGKSTITYILPDVSSSVSIEPEKITAGESTVVEVIIDNPEDVGINNIYIDASQIGGSSETPVDTNLKKQTITADIETTAGIKTLNVIVVDEFGNRHEDSFEIEVLAKTPDENSKTDFDWDEAVIYFLLTDRFANGDPSNDDPNGQNYDVSHPETYHGGDFQGIIDNLDYLEELGINTIWISPIVDNIDFNLREDQGDSQYGYHGYLTKDFTQIDEHLGDLDTFKKLIDEAHDRGIKIMLDVVLNHAGYGMEDSEIFQDMLQEDPVDSDPIRQELSGLPDFRTEDPEVREQLIKWQTDWIENSRTDRGDTIDYFRVDTVKHVEDTTWKEFKNELTKIDPSFKLIGEFYGGTIDNTGGYLGAGGMDSLLDFGFKDIAANYINGNIEGAEEQLNNRNAKINYNQMMGQFLSSHDEDGFLYSQANNDIDLFKVAVSLQLTAKGQPVIYYGEEIGMSGKTAGDMDLGEFNENRDDFKWEDVEDNDLLYHYQKLLSIRDDYSKLFARGDRNTLIADNEKGYSVFSRSYNDETLVIGLNTKDTDQEVTFEVDFETGTILTDLYGGGSYTVDKDQKVTVTLPANGKGGTMILVDGSVEPVEPEPTDPVEPELTDPVEPEPTDPVEPEPTDPVDPDDPESSPETGDNSPIELISIVIIFAIILLAIIIKYKDKFRLKQ